MVKKLWNKVLSVFGFMKALDNKEPVKPERHLLLYHGRQAICPKCAGMLMTPEPMRKHCIDCHADYICVGFGMADNELVYEEVLKDGG